MGAVNKLMIFPVGAIDVHVKTTSYEGRLQWGGREGASTELFEYM